MKKIILTLTIFTCTLFINKIQAQTDSSKKVDLFADMNNEFNATAKNSTEYTYATFKSTRIINGHTIETIGKNHLDFRISHRFGRINSGGDNLFGLDEAFVRFGFDYGVTDKLMIGVGRSNVDKEFDGFVKYKLLRQSSGKKNTPISVTLFGGIYQTTLKTSENFSGDLNTSYCTQAMIARKFNEAISFQITPTIVHRNLVNLKSEKNTLFSMGFGGRAKISKRVAFTAEYYHQFDKLVGTENSLSLGFDIETGGHVFQLHFSNSRGMSERSFITNTNGNWGKGDIHFGFNVTRIFKLGKAKDSKGW